MRHLVRMRLDESRASPAHARSPAICRWSTAASARSTRTASCRRRDCS